MDQNTIRKDRLRYTKNSLSSGFALLSILFNVFYFVAIYKSDVGNYYYQIMIGASIIYNLLFMLFTFLCSEGLKTYKINYAIVLIIVGLLQFVRMGILPKQAHEAIISYNGSDVQVMSDAQYAKLLIYLTISAAFAISGGIIGIIKSVTLNAYTKSLEQTNNK